MDTTRLKFMTTMLYVSIWINSSNMSQADYFGKLKAASKSQEIQ